MPNMNDVLRQAAVMQRKLSKLQEEAATKTYEAASGGGILSDKSNGYRACRILPCINHSFPLVKIRFWTIKTKAFAGNVC